MPKKRAPKNPKIAANLDSSLALRAEAKAKRSKRSVPRVPHAVTIRVSKSDFDILQLLRDHGWEDERIFDLGIRAAARYQSGDFDVNLKELNEREKP